MSATPALRRTFARAAVAAALLVSAAGALGAQEEGPELDARGKPRRPAAGAGYRPVSNNPTTGPFAGRYEYCFGGVGPQCAGVPVLAPNILNASGTGYTMKVSVGSILHDNCCLRNPQGKWCGGPGVNGSGKAEENNHNGQCVKEWDKAWWNAIDGRQWTVAVNPTQPANLTPTGGRLASLKDGSTITWEEVVQSRNFSAPAGTSLDRGDEAFCASGRASAPKKLGMSIWITCL